MNRELSLDIAGTRLLLLADKAVYWAEQKTLMVADVHFGKAVTYRALGQPVPAGTTANNLRRLDLLLSTYDCARLVFLGDFLHAPQAMTPAVLTALAAWRKRHPRLECLLVRGNHDLRAGDPPPELGIAVLGEPVALGPFALAHYPVAHAGLHTLAGHLHPVYCLQGPGRQRLRLPCFYSEPYLTVLPAFGDFTGGFDIADGADRRIFVTGDDGIWPVSVRRGSGQRDR